jgi:hypothetical protein
MSKGHGALQRRIITQVREAPSFHTIESLRWKFFEEDLSERSQAVERLSTSANTSFLRSALKLEQSGQIIVEKRPLSSLQECVHHYPSKTLDARVRWMRQHLLPALVEWVTDKSGAGPRYGESSNEEYHINENPEKVQTIGRQWTDIEKAVRHAFLETGDQPWLELICRVRFLLGMSNLKPVNGASWSVAQLVNACLAQSRSNQSLGDRLREFSNHVLPKEESESLKFKSLIHTFTEIPHRRECRLKYETCEELLKRRPEIVRQLSGFREPPESRWLRQFPREVKHYGPEIHKLFDKKVFEDFQFLKPALP